MKKIEKITYMWEGLMDVKLNNGFTEFKFDINRIVNKESEEWCSMQISVKNEFFNYKNEGELLLFSEVEEIKNYLEQLLNGKLEEEEQLDFTEPDLELNLYPSDNVEYILLDIKFNLIEQGELSADYDNLCLDKKEIDELYSYLKEWIDENKK